MKRDGNASDNQRKLSARTAQDDVVTGEPGPAESIQPHALLSRVLERGNMQRALKQLRRNKGAPGIDVMPIDDLPDTLRHHGPAVRAQLLSGSYRPRPVRRVEIPKPDGKARCPGIPTVLDRLILQAIVRVISAQWEPRFHRHSYGFRPRRSARQAVRLVQTSIRQGWSRVVDMDLQAFLDRVNHRTAVYVIRTRGAWEGGAARLLPIPIQGIRGIVFSVGLSNFGNLV